ncbi:DUF2934 domain-containing protein [Methylotenera sp.]|uniref:DUF2934 domain-containing protein n=1 Tax=Methylotenera sp. TaxID=2051956 RepID=UPI00272F00C4|nr:DUF2934 domain-containing protein [Methylotenera sp.]MDP2071977.1 DUF2934 domain-containing protein [Methylotenera sp.]MDP2231626.1 DUF2934 domain-containing protein [Methylotenera sp.]MDP3007014.1 DUF2934 domain-containing protein [Methylotenera sp.]MDP3007049.1 DUF2934 domain-containing protein [Methylotenera sp.]MDP3140846.1 DUF2934 domain-containing protein [Methylotenera sp.]
MGQSKAASKNSKNPIPVIGIESEQTPSADDKVNYIAVSAYYRAAARGYAPGHEIQDWLEAEAELAK